MCTLLAMLLILPCIGGRASRVQRAPARYQLTTRDPHGSVEMPQSGPGGSFLPSIGQQLPRAQNWVQRHLLPSMMYKGPGPEARMPTALHGMIWITRAFFMLAGRLPVLMFSFMIRTLVSFCSQEMQLGQSMTGLQQETCSEVHLHL